MSEHLKLPKLETRVISSESIKAKTAGRWNTDIIPVFQYTSQNNSKDQPKQKHNPKKAIPPTGVYAGIYRDTVVRLQQNNAFVAAYGTLEYLRFSDQKTAENALLVGMGEAKDLTEEKARQAGGHVWQRLKTEKSQKTTITHVIPADLFPKIELTRAFAEGLLLAAYEFNKYKSQGAKAGEPESKESKTKEQGTITFLFLTSEKASKQSLDRDFLRIKAMAESVKVTRDWSNEPSNVGTPEFYAEQAKKLAKAHGLKCKILTEKDAAREKMGLFLGVGQGADREGRIVVLEYTPKGRSKNTKTVALVGKGITFDSGGISLKPSLKMEEMKNDMTGAATVMGAIMLAAHWKVKNRVVAFMGFTENMPSGHAIQPGNIITSRSGKTVEIINTDAEGRLILADVLDYAQDFKPDAIVDIATLTGAVTIALGRYCCAVLGNDDALINDLRKSSEATGEKIWQLPLFDEYFDDLKSDTADMKNSANDSLGGTIRGATFLKQFIKKNVKWAHLDIAATATGLGYLPYYPKKGASGSYVRTLAKFVEDFNS